MRSRVDDIPIELSWKGLPAELVGSSIGDVRKASLTVMDEGWPTPCAILRDGGIEQNLRVMSAYCATQGVLLAPHAKTTMAPQLLQRQIDAGAWGLTVANVQQLRLLAEFGFRRFIIANEIVDPSEARWLARELARDVDLEVFVFADSTATVRLLAGAAGEPPSRPIQVLVELGIAGGRCGVRDVEDVVSLAHAIDRQPGVELAGVAGFEGVVGMVRNTETRRRARAFGAFLAKSLLAIRHIGLTSSGDQIATAGGSLFFAEVLEGWRDHANGSLDDVRFVLRSGCYVTQDNGAYAAESPLGQRSPLPPSEQLTSAIEVLAKVLSLPEPRYAVMNAGKRDVSYDVANPTLLWTGDPQQLVPAESAVCVGLNDQHSMFRGTALSRVSIGDRVGLGISHPCTTFDKWRAIALVDDDHKVLDLIVIYL
jgi:D-serine dehydratase